MRSHPNAATAGHGCASVEKERVNVCVRERGGGALGELAVLATEGPHAEVRVPQYLRHGAISPQ